jgi:hypothetical protein
VTLTQNKLDFLREKLSDPTLMNKEIIKICRVSKYTVQKMRKVWDIPLVIERRGNSGMPGRVIAKERKTPIKYKIKMYDGYGDTYINGEEHPVECKCPYCWKEHTLILKGNYKIKPRISCGNEVCENLKRGKDTKENWGEF